MTVCPQCGEPGSERYCGACGAEQVWSGPETPTVWGHRATDPDPNRYAYLPMETPVAYGPPMEAQPPPAYWEQPAGSSSRGRGALVAAGVAVTLLGTGIGWWFARSDAPATATSAPVTATSTAPHSATSPAPSVAATAPPPQTFSAPPPLPTPGGGAPGAPTVAPPPAALPPAPAQTQDAPAPSATPSHDAGAAAETKLAGYRQASLDGPSFDGHWVAQLASKYPGVYDKYQETRSGEHRFWTDDILVEHENLRGTFGDSSIRLVRSADLLHKKPIRSDMWVTFYDGDFSSRDQALAWCKSQFPGRSGERLENVCAPRQTNLS